MYMEESLRLSYQPDNEDVDDDENGNMTWKALTFSPTALQTSTQPTKYTAPFFPLPLPPPVSFPGVLTMGSSFLTVDALGTGTSSVPSASREVARVGHER